MTHQDSPWTERLGRSAVALLCAVLLVSIPVTAQAQAAQAAQPAKATVTLGAESPEALIERVRSAGESDDLGAVAALIAPEDRAMLSMTMILMLGMVMAFSQMGGAMAEGMVEGMAEGLGAEVDEEQRAAMTAEQAEAMAGVKKLESDFEETLKRYGVQDILESESDDPMELMADVDQVGLIRDLMALMEDLPGGDATAEDAPNPVDLPTGELSDLVIDGDTATASIAGEPVDFVRADGRWFLSLGLQEQMGGGEEGMNVDPGLDEDGESEPIPEPRLPGEPERDGDGE